MSRYIPGESKSPTKRWDDFAHTDGSAKDCFVRHCAEAWLDGIGDAIRIVMAHQSKDDIMAALQARWNTGVQAVLDPLDPYVKSQEPER